MFNDLVLSGYTIKGKSFITPKEYEQADEETQYYYEPAYRKYRTIKERSYNICDSCGHKEFLGWTNKDLPVGEPIRYELRRQALPYSLYKANLKMVVDSINHSNVLARRILNQ